MFFVSSQLVFVLMRGKRGSMRQPVSLIRIRHLSKHLYVKLQADSGGQKRQGDCFFLGASCLPLLCRDS